MAFPGVAQRGSHRLDDKEPEARKGKATSSLLQVLSSLGIMLKIRNSNQSRQEQQDSQAWPDEEKRGREGGAVQRLAVLISGSISLPSAAHARRPGNLKHSFLSIS